MSVLGVADKVFLGDFAADAVYQGDTKVWSAVPPQLPATIPGLAVWLDGADYKPGSWPNKGSNPAVTIAGTPPMTVGPLLNGLPTVRFAASEGRVRGTWPSPVDDWTVIYIVRSWGPHFGRAFTVQYPPSNLLVGMHTSKRDSMYDNGVWLDGADTNWGTWPTPGPWRTYGADSAAGASARFFIDGALIGTGGATGADLGFVNGWALSGYGPGTEETMDIDVAELVIYNRKLSDSEREQVEFYLRNKWLPPLDPATAAYMTATGLDSSYAPALDLLVTGLKKANLWSKMIAIYPFVGGTAALHKWNLKDPRDLDAAYRLTFNGGVSIHSTALGYRANPPGATVNGPGYADTNFVPLGALSQDSTHLAFYSLEDTPSADRAEMGCFNWTPSGRFHVIVRYSGVNAFYYGQAEAGASNVPVPAASGLFVATRIASNDQAGYRNGVKLSGANPAASIALPPVSVLLGAISGFANRTDVPCGFASIGTGLTAQNNADLYNVVQMYQTALGRQVGLAVTPPPPTGPTTVQGLGLWLEADAIDGTEGGQITSWPDKGPHRYSVTPNPTAPVWKQAGVNGRPSVYFNSNSRLLISGWGNELSGKSAYTLFHVMTAENPGTDPVVLTAPTTNVWQWLTEVASANAGFYWGQSNASFNTFDANISSTAACILTCSLALPGAGGPKMYKNSVQIASVAQGSQGPMKQTVPAIGSDVFLGAYYNNSLGVAGHIAAILWYDRFLIDSDRQKIEAYLMTKYGIGP